MASFSLKLACTGTLVLLLCLSAQAQNTKGDKPAGNRETRFKKTTKKQKPAKRVKSGRRTTSSLRAYTPRKKSRGGERAGRPVSPLMTNRPSEKPRNVFPQRGTYVHNNARKPGRGDKIRASSARSRVVTPRSSSRSIRNVYPQSGQFVNYSSHSDRRPPKPRKVTPRSASRSFSVRRSLNAWTRWPKPSKRGSDRPYKGDISGRKIRTKNFQSRRPAIVTSPGGKVLSRSNRIKNVYPQSARVSTHPTRQTRDHFRQRYTDTSFNPSSSPRSVERATSNRRELADLKALQTPRHGPGRKRTVRPRSSSGAFISRRSTNTWSQFPRPRQHGERAVTKDIAGRPLRMKNFETKRPILVNPTARPYQRGRDRGDRPYKSGGARYSSRSRSGKAWQGDVSNRRIRKNFSSKSGTEGKAVISPQKRRLGMRVQGEGYTGNIKTRRPLKGGGSLSGGFWNNRGRAIPPRAPGIGGRGIGKYQGNLRGGKSFGDQGEDYTGSIKARRPLKGGGSVSGRLWNNKRKAIAPRVPRRAQGEEFSGNLRGGKIFNNQGEEYSGNIKARRPFKGGGSVSGRLWNNNRKAIAPRVPRRAQGEEFSGNLRGGKILNNQGEEYSGNIKAHRPFKGGGSVSGRLWNNNRKAISPRVPRRSQGEEYSGNLRGGKIFNNQGEEFSGNIKAHRPLKGGGSVSGRLWNNNRKAIPPRVPRRSQGEEYSGNLRGGKVFSNQGEEFSGNIKTHRPEKGGGSVSGKLWNNSEKAIPPRVPGRSQGEEFSGNIKAHRPVKGGGSVSGKLWNNHEKPIEVRAPKSDQGGEFAGHIKLRRGYVKNPNAADEAIKKRRPTPETYKVDGLQVRVARPEYGKRKNAPDGALAGLKPSRSTVKAGEFVKGMKRTWNYVKNPSSAEDARRVREPGKAFARATDYQGNIKMNKFDLFNKRGLHPDAQFAKKNNVDGERDMLTNLKLWWARLFRKNETQPDHLKDKRGKPRYDKGEQGLWYD